MTPNERSRLEALSACAFDLAKRMQIGREYLREFGRTHEPAETGLDVGVPCSLAYHIRRSHKRAAKAIRKNADEIINQLYKSAALNTIKFES